MLEVCEIGVAVAHALPSFKDRADVILAELNGAGTASFLRSGVLGGAPRARLAWLQPATPAVAVPRAVGRPTARPCRGPPR